MGGQSSGRRWARSCRFLKSAVYIIATSAGQHNPASTGRAPLPTCSLDYYSSSVIRPARTIRSFCAGPDRRSMPTALRYSGGPSARPSSGVLSPPVAHGSSPGESDAVLAKDSSPKGKGPCLSPQTKTRIRMPLVLVSSMLVVGVSRDSSRPNMAYDGDGTRAARMVIVNAQDGHPHAVQSRRRHRTCHPAPAQSLRADQMRTPTQSRSRGPIHRSPSSPSRAGK